MTDFMARSTSDEDLSLPKKAGLCGSLKAMLAIDFAPRVIFKQMLLISFATLLAIGQETIWIFFLTGFDQPVLNYTSIEKIFEEEPKPPILTLYNAVTPEVGSTASLMDFYKEKMNEEIEQVTLEAIEWHPEESLTVEETISEAAD